MSAGTILVVLSGLPGSGREEKALEWVSGDPEGRVRSSRDEMRELLTGRVRGLSGSEERRVTAAQRGLVRGLLASGHSVVVDDVNAKVGHRQEWAKIADDLGVPSVMVDIDADLEQCIARDKGSKWPYGEKAIRDMHSRGAETRGPGEASAKGKGPARHKHAKGLPTAWIFDIDGTLALNDGHRGWYGEEELKVGADSVRTEIVKLVRALLMLPFDERDELIFMTGRTERCRDQTREWLLRACGLSGDEELILLMREVGDRRKDTVVKDDLFEKHVAGRYNVLGAFEDKPSVSMHWYRKGLKVLHVGDPW